MTWMNTNPLIITISQVVPPWHVLNSQKRYLMSHLYYFFMIKNPRSCKWSCEYFVSPEVFELLLSSALVLLKTPDNNSVIFPYHKISDNLCRSSSFKIVSFYPNLIKWYSELQKKKCSVKHSTIITTEEKNVITHHQDLIEAVTESVMVQMLVMKQFTPTLKSGSLSLSLSSTLFLLFVLTT